MPSWSQVENGVLSAVSGRLGMTQTDLTAQLRSGKSMNELAAKAGVSASDLTSTLHGALAQSGLPGANYAQMATRLAAKTNNADLPDATTSTAAPPLTTGSTGSSRGVDTSSVGAVRLGGLSLDSSEVSLLLGSTGRSFDSYL